MTFAKFNKLYEKLSSEYSCREDTHIMILESISTSNMPKITLASTNEILLWPVICICSTILFLCFYYKSPVSPTI